MTILSIYIFNRFDSRKNGALSESDFVIGWVNHSRENSSDLLLRRIKELVGEDNVLL